MDENVCMQSDLSSEKKVFSRIGLSFFLLVVITVVFQLAIGSVTGQYAPHLVDEAWFIWTVSLVPLYLFAFPVFWLIIRKVPSVRIAPYHMSVGRFVLTAMMCIALMYIGNIIGTVLSALMAPDLESMMNPVQEIILGSNLVWNFLFAVLIAPIGEEFLFRKLLIDKTARYGEGTAVLLSGLFFALFHGNFYQVFYAFLLGLMFGYIYVKTGKLRYPIILHMLINFLGAIIGPAILALNDGSMQNVMLIGLYGLVIIGLAIAGFVLLIVKRKSFVMYPGECVIPKEKRFSVVGLNAGTMLFIIACLGLFVLNIAGLYVE